MDMIHQKNNLQAAHYCCNQTKGAKTPEDKRVTNIKKCIGVDGEW